MKYLFLFPTFCLAMDLGTYEGRDENSQNCQVEILGLNSHGDHRPHMFVNKYELSLYYARTNYDERILELFYPSNLNDENEVQISQDELFGEIYQPKNKVHFVLNIKIWSREYYYVNNSSLWEGKEPLRHRCANLKKI